ncbi:MAG: hypothetical protein AAF491_10400 [Verrucomicrobiota bacterium]
MRTLLLFLLLPILDLSQKSFGNDDPRPTAAAAVEEAHRVLWERFFDPHDTMLDYTDLSGEWSAPTPDECRENKPNALAWWMPNENGAMFNGLYLDAMLQRWPLSGSEADKEKCRRLVAGLRFLSGVSETPGFIARGVASDDKTVYALGSNDQTFPWFYGLWRYVTSEIPSEEERAEIIREMGEVARILQGHQWRMPSARPPFQFRGTFGPITWEASPRILFLFRALHQLTGEDEWEEFYQEYLEQKNSETGATRREICAQGMVFHSNYPHSWTGSVSVCALRGLWEMETDEELREEYARGLRASAELAIQSIELFQQFEVDSGSLFESDWRKLNRWWKPQTSAPAAVEVAKEQLQNLHRISPRRREEARFVREPLFAAWVVSLCPDEEFVSEYQGLIEDAIRHYDYERLYLSQFFPAENAWYRLKMAVASEGESSEE